MPGAVRGAPTGGPPAMSDLGLAHFYSSERLGDQFLLSETFASCSPAVHLTKVHHFLSNLFVGTGYWMGGCGVVMLPEEHRTRGNGQGLLQEPCITRYKEKNVTESGDWILEQVSREAVGFSSLDTYKTELVKSPLTWIWGGRGGWNYKTCKIFIGQSMDDFQWMMFLWPWEKEQLAHSLTGSSPFITSSSGPGCSFPLIHLFLPSPSNIPPSCERLCRGGFWEDACVASREHWNGKDEWDFPLVTWTRKNSRLGWSHYQLWAQSGRMSVDGEGASVLWCPRRKGRMQGSVNCQKCLWSKGR